jgi:hypothetical protein
MELLTAETEVLVKKCIELAKSGDTAALRFALERICPAPKGRIITLDLPVVRNAEGVVNALSAITRAVAAGELAPAEANEVAALLDSNRKAIETNAFESRLSAVEKAIAGRKA